MTETPGMILKKSMDRLKKARTGFSMNSLANKIRVSGAFLSKLFNDKAGVPDHRVEDLIQFLKMDRMTASAFRQAILRAKMQMTQSKVAPEVSERVRRDYQVHDLNDFSILKKWYYLAVLAYLTTERPESDPRKISERMGLPLAKAQEAVDFLVSEGYAKVVDGLWVVYKERIRFPTEKWHPAVSSYHGQLLSFASSVMKSQTSARDFDRRLVSGVCVAANPKNLEKAKRILHEAVYQAAEVLMDDATGPCTEVAQISGLLIPVDKGENRG